MLQFYGNIAELAAHFLSCGLGTRLNQPATIQNANETATGAPKLSKLRSAALNLASFPGLARSSIAVRIAQKARYILARFLLGAG